jgi:hypothetical protein
MIRQLKLNKALCPTLEIIEFNYPKKEEIASSIKYSTRKTLLVAFKLKVKYTNAVGEEVTVTDNCFNLFDDYGL